MAECILSFDLVANPQTGDLSLVITDSDGNDLPVTENLKALINQCIADAGIDNPDAETCYEHRPDDVEFTAGPGAANPAATAAVYQVSGKPTRVCVSNSDSGQQSIYWILNDSNGDPQWHQSEN